MYKSILPLPSTTCYSRCLVVELNTECGDSHNSNVRSTTIYHSYVLSKICGISKSLFSYKNWNIATYKWLLQGLGIIIFTFQNIAYCMGPINGIEKVFFFNENSCLRKKKDLCLLVIVAKIPSRGACKQHLPCLPQSQEQIKAEYHQNSLWKSMSL